MAVADFNEDGQLDLAVVRFADGTASPNASALRILLGVGNGGFRALMPTDVPIGETAIVLAGEFTGDGHADLVAVPQSGSMMMVLAGDGAGRFSVRDQPVALGGFARGRATADFNADGHTDVVITDGPVSTNGMGSLVRVLLGDGLGAFSEATGSALEFAEPVWQVASADFNSDGAADLAVGLNWGADVLRVFLGDDQGGLRPLVGAITWTGSVPGPLRSVWLLESADFDADGRQDLAVMLQGTERVHVLLGDGRGHFREVRVDDTGGYQPGNSPSAMAIGNFNGDRHADVAIGVRTDDYARGAVRVLLSTGSGRLREAPGSPEYPDAALVTMPPDSANALTAADLNADGYDDLAVLDAYADASDTLPVLINSAGRARKSDRVPILSGPKTRRRYGTPFGARVRLPAYVVCEPEQLAGRRMALFRRLATHTEKAGPWRRLIVKVTDKRGRVSATDRPSANAEYRWMPADRRRPRLKASPTVDVSVEQTVSLLISGDKVRGTVRPPHPGAHVVLQRSNEEGGDEEEWTTIARSRLTPTSKYTLTVPRRRGLYRVCRNADRAHQSGASRELRRPPGTRRLIALPAARLRSMASECRGPHDP